MRQVFFHLLLFLIIWVISHTSPVAFLWQIYPIVWFILLINQQLTFVIFLCLSCLMGFIADFEIMPIATTNSQGLFWGISSVFLIVTGSIQRLIPSSIVSHIIYIGLAHELYKFFIQISYSQMTPNTGIYILQVIFNLIFIISISTLIFLIQERVNLKRNLV